MKKLTKIISPSYVRGFKCIGGACEDSCCIGWDIDIDKITYRRYFRTKDAAMKKEFIKQVYRNEDCDTEEVDYGRVHINEETKWCPFLDKNKLCRIYSTLGEDYLSNVCYSYPRVYNILDDVYEMSLFMSCPEAIRKMLSSREPMKFIEEERVLEKHIIHSYMDSCDKRWKNSSMKRLKELRTMSINMVQDRQYPLTERLLQLGHKLEKLSSSEVNGSTYSGADLNRQGNSLIQVAFFKEAIESLEVFTEIDSPLFIEQTKKVMTEFRLDYDTPLEKQALLYKKAMSSIVQPFLEGNDYLFEHYLVNFMFQTNFPFSENQNLFDGYVMMVIRYCFIRFYLAGIGVSEGKLTKNNVVTMIQVYTKTVEHHKTFILDLLEYIKEEKLDNMAFIASLLG